MGKRGSKKVPTALLAKRGSWRAKIRPDEITENPTPEIAFPEWCTPKARKHWNELIPLMDELGLMAKSFSTPACMLVNALADYIDATKEIEACERKKKDSGWYVETLNTIKLHPRVTRRDNAFAQVMKGCIEFGLTPSSRAGIAIDVKKATTGKKSGGDDEPLMRIV